MTMGSRIKELRLEKKLTQESLGDILGVQQSAIRKYEYNEVDLPKSKLQLLADYFDVSVDYLLGRTDWRNSKVREEQIQAWDEASNPKLADNVKLILEIEKSFGKPSVEMLNQFNELNDIGKEKAIEYVSDLTDNEKYTEKNTPGSACG